MSTENRGTPSPTTGVGDVSQRPPPVTLQRVRLSRIPTSDTRPCQKGKEREKSLPAADDSPDGSSRGASGRSQTSPQILCPHPKSPNDHQEANIRCKSKRVFITKLELGVPLYRHSCYREEPRVLDYIAYIGSVHEKKNF